MAVLSWLHVSDLHWRESQYYDARVVTRRLLEDLTRQDKFAPDLMEIDFVFVTGDLAWTSQPREYELARQFLAELRKTVGVPPSRLFVVPGNHDVDRSAITDEARALLRGLRTRKAVNDLLGIEDNRATVMKRFHRYQEFANNYLVKAQHFNSIDYFYVKRLRHKGVQIAVLGLNSAWASDKRVRRMLLGERQVVDALDQATRSEVRIALMHHPPSCLRPFDFDACEPLILRGCDFLLHGHLHGTHVRHLKDPGSDALVLGAGATFEGRDFPNAYNLVCFNPESGMTRVYLRMYSDKQGGFWAPDSMSYPEVVGQCDLHISPKPRQNPDLAPAKTSPQGRRPGGVAMVKETPGTAKPAGGEAPARWWHDRGYKRNPFQWPSAAYVKQKDWPQMFEWWYIDPGVPSSQRGLGARPTLNAVTSPEFGGLVLLYVPSGGGKTFCRRWAAWELNQSATGQRVVEVFGLARKDQLPDPRNVTACDLATCIYKAICKFLKVNPGPHPGEHVEHILSQCDALIEQQAGAAMPDWVYVFFDDIDRLFGTDSSAAGKNSKAFAALVELCRAAAGRGGEEPLTLRIFVPSVLKEPLQSYLVGELQAGWIREHTITWSTQHCVAILDKRLDSCYKEGPGKLDGHLSWLLADSEILETEFDRWRGHRKELSPRTVIDLFDRLGHHVHSKVAPTEQIGVDLWRRFLDSEMSGYLGSPEVPYPGI
jgi:predicted MPP superfamily phosphohydrolase